MEADSNQEEHLISESVKLRNYQMRILEEAKKKNSIVFLPTGSGKTLIAIHVLCSKMSEVMGPFPEKAKRVFFIAPTKILVYQLFKVVKIHTKFKVGMYIGDMLLDFWTKNEWNEEFQKYQVLIMTGEILKQILQLSILEPSQICLIVLDECHHAIMDHPYRLILQQIAKEPVSKAPLILGLSAVLLNANPKKKNINDIIKDLLTTFRGKILTESQLNEVKRFSAIPEEQLISYKADSSSVKFIFPLYKETSDLLETMILKAKGEIPIPADGKPYSNTNLARKFKNFFESAQETLEECGLFSGTLSLLYYIILCEKYRLMSSDADIINVLVYCRTMFHKIRHILLKEISEETGEKIFKHSSNKIQVLLTLLKDIKQKFGEKYFSILIFVRKRVTAIIIASLLKRLKDVDSNFSFLKPEYVIGSSIFDNEMLLHEFDNEAIVKQFDSHELNILVATNVLEEGVDISSCNVVISFDFPVSYASYFQSRGRARDKEGFYFILVKEEEMLAKTKLLREYREIEVELHKAIQSDETEFSDLDVSIELDESDQKSMLAVKAVYRYCGKLPQDKFSFLSPTAWYREYNGTEKMFKASVLLPVNCPIHGVIEGELRTNSKLAKRSAFLMVLEKLQAIGEIDEDLNVVPFEMKERNFDYLFPHYITEKISKDLPQPGTKKRKQTYEAKFAKCLSECLPQPGQKVYIHVIDFTIKFDKIEMERKKILQEVLENPVTFAILSSKKLSKICEFPMFLDMGRIDCNLLINYDEGILFKSDLEDIKLCHFAVFQKVLRIVKNWQVFDNRNKGHAFYVAPVKKNKSGKFVLDWEIIRSDFCKNNTSAIVRYNPFGGRNPKRQMESKMLSTSNEVVPVSAICGRQIWGPDVEPHFTMVEADYEYFVISPNYRMTHPPQLYIVNKFCKDLSPLSQFPNEHFEDYCTYYEKKYAIKITNEKQPLMKVAFIFNCANFNKPRNFGNQEKLRGALKNQEELLVPELCDVLPFDRRYWLKALLIPTALNRICHLYSVEEFRQKIVTETGLGELELPICTKWEPLDVDVHLRENEDETAIGSGKDSDSLKLALPLSQFKDKSKSDVKIMNPTRNLYEIGLCDMEYLVKLLKDKKPEHECLYQFIRELQAHDPLILVKELQGISSPSLKVLQGMRSRMGPGLAQLLQAFTSSSANDIVNYERLEILGDSFLKFATTIFLFKNFNVNEGILTSLKGKMVGNRNLLYCGLAKGFQYVLNVTETAPLSDWNPPLVCLPEKLVDVIMANEIDPAVIYRWEIPVNEQFSGEITEETIAKNKEITEKYQKVCEFPTNSLLPYKSIGDKTLSDSVEAVIGLYLSEFGLPGGFEILMWLDILPKFSASYNELMNKVERTGIFSTPSNESVMNILREGFYLDLEKTLGYQFKSKALLLEALTHPSYGINRVTDCYQRLEFLGDAILDFLITSYVYEYCGDLTPGQVTDIRSSLVNNITFASLAVRYDFHKYLLKMNSQLNKAIEEFVFHQSSRNHVIDDNVLFLAEEKDCLIAEAVQVPKALGDVFESLAGAIYLDSGNSLKTVWAVFYRLMKNEIDTFTSSIPKSSVRLLHEICQEKPYFEMGQIDGAIRVACTVWYEKAEIKVYGFGANSKEAKRSAAKLALKKIAELKK